MQKGVLVPVAALLAACGVGASTTNEVTDSGAATSANDTGGAGMQEANKVKPQPVMSHYDQGGSAGCFDPNLTGQARAAAERIGVPCEQDERATLATARGGADLFAGRWSADFDGGGGNVTIIRRSPTENSYWIEMGVANEQGCAGELSGEGNARNNRLTLRVPVPNDSNQCVVDFTRQGRNLSIRSDYCHNFSGLSCGFTGTARFLHETETLEPPMD